jgi:CRP-like cAMP-binding protein
LVNGAEVTMARASDGESFAEAALFSKHHHCDAIAEIESEVLSVPATVVRAGLERDADVARALLAGFAKQVRDLRGAIEMRNIRPASDRLLAWIEFNAAGTPLAMRLSGSWAVVATEIGLTPEATYRALSALERSGRIARPTSQSVIVKAIAEGSE